jgi:hypothetical protein
MKAKGTKWKVHYADGFWWFQLKKKKKVLVCRLKADRDYVDQFMSTVVSSVQ